jgi:curved DNA-binding protein CbpA
MENFYDILGIEPQATETEIKQAYRTACKKLHPDMGGTDADFQALNEAYKVLSDPRQREEYDEILFGYPQQEQQEPESPQQEPEPSQQETASSKSGFFSAASHFLLRVSSYILIYYGVKLLAEYFQTGRIAQYIIYILILYYINQFNKKT